MTPSLEATLRRLSLAKLRAYRAIRYQRGKHFVASLWYRPAHTETEQEAARQQWEAGLAEIDALIAERQPTQQRLGEE